jgi:hypothetical protein
MTFLQPWVLLGLPLLALPIIIHLLNRMRHRPKPWAAMRFLISATRSSISQTRLRQFLILLFRVLAVLMLLLFLARPLAGGWVGWALSPAPDAIVILLDRSASMEIQAGGVSKRAQAVQLLTSAAHDYEQSSHLVLIDSATRVPQEITRADSLAKLSVTQPTDTAADLPAMLRAAFDWLIDNKAGAAEIWIASDNQKSNWLPEDPRWKSVIAQFSGMSQKVRIRLLELTAAPAANASISIKELSRYSRRDRNELQVVLDIQRTSATTGPLPVALTLDGVRSEREVTLEGQSLRWRQKIDLGARREGGWGSFTLPSDANLHDNVAYFVYGPDIPLQALLITGETGGTGAFRYGAASRDAAPAKMIRPTEFATANLDGKSLLIWQAPFPSGADASRLESFAAQGGVVVFFPPGQSGGALFQGISWGDAQKSESPDGFRIVHWTEDEGPLAKSDEHTSLPLAQTTFLRRQLLSGRHDVLAAFEDGAPFLMRQMVGKGQIYFCASLPVPAWSDLGDGPVLVPMLQRMLSEGGRRLQQASSADCGELSATEQGKQWISVDSATPKDIHTQAGVYHSGDQLLAVNRPVVEDDPDIIDSAQAQKLFGDLPVQAFQQRHLETGQLQGEIWRLFVFAMLLSLMVEAILILPAPRVMPKEQAA